MQEKTFSWLITILLICGTIAFKIEMDHFYPVAPTDTNTLAQEHCINGDGVPINDNNGQMLDCRVYKIDRITPTLMPTPIAGVSATPTNIPLRASSANATNSGY